MSKADFLAYLEYKGMSLSDLLEGLSLGEKKKLAYSLIMGESVESFPDICKAIYSVMKGEELKNA